MFFPVGEKSISWQDSQNKVFNSATRELLTWKAGPFLPFVTAVMTDGLTVGIGLAIQT
jgi:hypothetical protein